MQFSHQKCHSFVVKSTALWDVKCGDFGVEIWWVIENRSIIFGKTIDRLYMERSIVFEKTNIHF